MPQPLRPRLSPAVGTLLLLIGLNLLNYIDRYILPGEVSLIQREFHSTDQQMGALTTALFVFYMLAAPLTGWLGDRFRRKPLIIAGAVLWSVATLGTAWVHDYWTLYMRHALVGVGEATFGIFAPAVLADFYPERDRNRILSIFYLAIPVGAALGYLAGGELGSPLGLARRRFFVCAIPGLVIAALLRLGWAASRSAASCDHIAAHREPRHGPGALPQSGLSHGHLRPGHAHLCHGRHLGLGAHVPAPLRRALSGQRQPGRRRHHGHRRHCRNPGRRLDRAALAAHQLPRALPALLLERGPHPALRRSCLLRPSRLGHPGALCRRVLPLPQYRPAQRRHRELGLRAGSRHGHLRSTSSAFTSSATPSRRRSSAPSPTAPTFASAWARR